MTDSLLQSYQRYSYTSVVPYPVSVIPPVLGALELLDGETDGWAISAITYDSFVAAAYVGGPVGGAVAVIDTGVPANDLSDVPLDTSNLVQSGTSPKMVEFDSTPYIRWSPHNLHKQSQTFDNSGWVKASVTVSADTADTVAPDGTSTADKITLTSNAGILYSCTGSSTIPPGVAAGVTYTASVYAKKGSTADWFALFVSSDSFANRQDCYFDLNSGVLGSAVVQGSGVTLIDRTITSAGNGWYRCTVTFSYTAAEANFGLVLFPTSADAANGTSGDICYAWGAQFVRGINVNPYLATTSAVRIGIPQSYDTEESKYGIWVEPGTTNLLVRSEAFDNASWSKQSVTIAANNTTAPDGASTADKLTADSGSTQHYALQQITFTAANHTCSAYIKSSTHRYVTLSTGIAGSGTNKVAVTFDLTGVAVTQTDDNGTPVYVSSSITAIGGGWYRCSFTATFSGASYYVFVSFASGATPTQGDYGLETYSTAGTEAFWLWGAQAELGSIATSCIPTVSSTVTRAADVISALDTTFPGSDTNNTIYLDYKPIDVGSGTRYGWAYWKDANNFYSLAGVTANPTMGNTNAGSPEFAVDIGTLVAGTRTQITIAAKGSDFDGSQDGVAPTAQGTATLTTGYTTLYLGTFGATGSELNGYIYRMVVVPYQRETVNGDLEAWKYEA